MIHKNPTADLQAGYRKTLEVSAIIALSLAIVAFKFFPDVQPPKPLVEPSPGPPLVAEIPPTVQPKRPPPPARPPIVIEAPIDETLPDVRIDTGLNPDAPVPPPAPAEDRSEVIFIPVQYSPEPVGGFATLQRNVVYPDIARRVGLEGTVVVLAFIDEQGIVDHAEVVRGVGGGCDEAAVNAVMKTRFHPATQRGKPVKVKAEFKIGFKLQR
jgi:periplasmic protein TonB